MFPSARNSPLAQRAFSALRLTRSFLLLEDDYDVDWEVDRNEHVGSPHLHRAPLRGRPGQRRPGQPAPAPGACLCAVAPMTAELASAPTRRDDERRANTSCGRGAPTSCDRAAGPAGGGDFAREEGSSAANYRRGS